MFKEAYHKKGIKILAFQVKTRTFLLNCIKHLVLNWVICDIIMFN